MTDTTGTALTILGLVGSFAFATSGALAAVRAGLDVFGVAVVAAATGLAGGIARDVLLGVRPEALRDWRFGAVVIGAAIFAIAIGSLVDRSTGSVEVAEAIGLAFVCIAGTLATLDDGGTALEAVLLGALTGTGGGVVRDLLLGRPPVLLRRGFVAIPALVGTLAFVIAYEAGLPETLTVVIGMVVVLALRIAGIRGRFDLPRLG